MRKQFVAALAILALPLVADAAWVSISSETGRRVEIDPASVRKEADGKQVVLGRILFDKELIDARTSAPYKSIEALTRYDCAQRTFTTLKRSWRKPDGEMLREEEVKSGIEMPVRSGSIDDKMLREVCRPRSPGEAQSAASQVVDKANEAAADLRRANEAMIRKEVEKEMQKGVKTAALPAPKGAAAPREAAAAKETHAPLVAAAPSTAPTATAHPRPAKRPPAEGAHGAAQRHAHMHWAYDGEGRPENWAKLDPANAQCASGKRQSPIDIRDGIRVDQPTIEFAWRPSLFRIVDNGHTVQVALSGSSLSLLGKRYELLQFHFHRPAEERVEGRGFEMVAHFVHKSGDGKLAVVAVLMEQGAENPFVQTLWNHLPLEKGEEVASPTVQIDPATFLPADRGYYNYMGSLTTPPCSEGVLWLVMKQPVQVSAEQIATFSRLYRNNARPLQPSFGRLIKESR